MMRNRGSCRFLRAKPCSYCFSAN